MMNNYFYTLQKMFFKGIHILVSETCEIREISEMYTVYNIVSFQKTTADWTILIVHLVTF